MIISDKYRFVFIHIPKCAGTFVRKALAPYDDYHGWFNDRIDTHSKFGKLDFVHLPLAVMQKVLPKEYKKVVSYDAYALVRDPHSRFQSSFAQYVKMYRGTELAQMEKRAINQEIDKLICILQSAKFLTDPRFIHFMHQEKFLKDDTGYHVDNIYPITKVNKLLTELSKRTGESISLENDQNKTLVMKAPLLRKQILYTSQAMKQILPQPFYHKVRQSARRLLMRPIGGECMPIFKEKRILRFIENYYESDFLLYEQAQRQHGERWLD